MGVFLNLIDPLHFQEGLEAIKAGPLEDILGLG
jgi:hypothetical protein